MKLRRPRLEDKDAVMALIMEFESLNAAHDGGFGTRRILIMKIGLLGTEMQKWVSIFLIPGCQLYNLSDLMKDKQLVLNLRLRLNEYLLEHGGPIGYSVRPSMQGRGYATSMLKEGLLVAASKNIHQVLVTCAVDNPASRAVILKMAEYWKMYEPGKSAIG